jgi:hypothetical protein
LTVLVDADANFVEAIARDEKLRVACIAVCKGQIDYCWRLFEIEGNAYHSSQLTAASLCHGIILWQWAEIFLLES